MKSLEHLERVVELHDRVEQLLRAREDAARAGAAQRRARQKRNARDLLESALATFDEFGAPLGREGARRARADRRPRLLPAARSRRANVASPSSSPKGRRTRRVAAALVVAERTVESALTQIYRKPDVRSRTELARKLDDSR